MHKTYAKICAFGYVVCDENFNILKKEDILINPKGRFELTDRKGEKGIVLPYTYSDFAKQPPFTEVYGKIKRLLEDEDSYVLGHAVLNDVKYLNLETKRFRLPSFNFTFYDSQLLFMTHINDFSRQFGLEYIANALNVEFVPHKAADDAYATMSIVKALCSEYGCGFKELLEKLKVTGGRIDNYSVSKPASRGFGKYNAEKNARRRQRSENRVKFFNNLTKKRVNREGGKLKGKILTFSRAIEDDIAYSMPLVDAVYSAGGRYSQKLDKCNLYVAADDDATARTQSARERGIARITPSQLESVLHD